MSNAQGGRHSEIHYTLDELDTLLLMDLGYAQAIAIKRKRDVLIEAKVLGVVWVDAGLASHAWSVFERFNADKHWPFTDCVSHLTPET